jgi:hypothetical protein
VTHLEPPPITIVDPNATTDAGDVLDSGRDPWRPTKRQRLTIAAAAAAVALVAGGVTEVRHVRHENALDAAAVRDVAFTVDDSDGFFISGEEPTVTLVSTGKLPVQVLGVTVDWPGYAERTADVRLESYGHAQVEVTSGKTCSTAMYTDQPRRLRVRARSARGEVVTRTVVLPDQAAEMLGAAERFRCEFLRPDEAFVGEVTAAAVRGRTVALTVSVRNAGVERLTVSRLAFLPGVEATAHLPLVLPPGGTESDTVPVPVTLRVGDCAAFARGLATPGEELSPYALSATVSSAYVSGRQPGRVPVSSLFQLSTGDESGNGLVRTLARTCPSSLFPAELLHSLPALGFSVNPAGYVR